MAELLYGAGFFASTAFTPSGPRPFMADDEEDRRVAEYSAYAAAVNGARPDGVNAVLPDP
jgi:hypothetical protein